MYLQLDANDMGYYLDYTSPLHLSPRNLFCLRYDLHLGGFDQAQFVVVPKGGDLVVHFLRRSEEAANLYHNVGFNHGNHLSQEALYARFAWALTNIIKESALDPESFKFFEAEGANDSEIQTPEASGEKGKGKGRKRKYDDTGEGNGENSGNRERYNNTSGTHGGRSTIGHQDCDAPPLPLPSDPWLSDVLLKLAPGDQSSVEADAHEIQQDMKKAARDHPFLSM